MKIENLDLNLKREKLIKSFASIIDTIVKKYDANILV